MDYGDKLYLRNISFSKVPAVIRDRRSVSVKLQEENTRSLGVLVAGTHRYFRTRSYMAGNCSACVFQNMRVSASSLFPYYSYYTAAKPIPMVTLSPYSLATDSHTT